MTLTDFGAVFANGLVNAVSEGYLQEANGYLSEMRQLVGGGPFPPPEPVRRD